jgi:hypothetical protein
MHLSDFLRNNLDKFLGSGFHRDELKLCLQEITEDNARETAIKLANLDGIDHLSIDFSHTTDFQIKCFFNAISINSKITSLAIRYDRIDATYRYIEEEPLSYLEQIDLIVKELEANEFIETLHLCDIPILDDSLPNTLFSFLQSNEVVSSLNLYDFNDKNVISSVFLAVKKRQSITNLSLINTGVGGIVLTSQMIQLLAVEDGFNTKLHGLHLDGVRINDKEIGALVQVLGRYINIKNLSIVFSRMTQKSVSYIVNLLQTNNNLTHLDINSNQLGVKAIKKLGDLLKTNTTLRSLDLSYTDTNQVQELSWEEGWNYLLSCLQTNKTLCEIVVDSDEGVKNFVCWPKIVKILDNNKKRQVHSPTDVCRAAAGLDQDESRALQDIESVELDATPIGSSWPEMVRLLKTMPALKTLSLKDSQLGNDFSSAVVRNIYVEKVSKSLFKMANNTTAVTKEERSNKYLKLG